MHFLALLLLLPALAFAKDTTYGNVTVSRVVSVYDGDTIKVKAGTALMTASLRR